MARKPSGMHVEDVKACLRKKWGSLAGLSRHLGKNANAVTQTLSKPGYSVPTELAIAKELGREPYEIWPDRYHVDGSPVTFRVDRTPTRHDADNLRRNGAAA